MPLTPTFTAASQGSTEIDVDWDLSVQIAGKPILSLTVTQFQGVLPNPNTLNPNTGVSQSATSQKGQLKFKNLLPSTTYAYQLNAAWQDWDPSTPPIDRIPAGLTLAAAAMTTSGLTDVTDGKLVFDLVYAPIGATAPETVDVQSNPTFSSSVPAALDQYLTKSIGSVFDAIWNGPTSTKDATPLRQNYATPLAKIIAKEAAAAGYTINNVQVTLPTSGRVLAHAHDATPVSANHPAASGALVISYQLSGCKVDFDYGSVTTAWEVSFDAAVTITVSLPPAPPIPANPPPPATQTSLVVSSTEIIISNAGVSPENAGAALAAFFDNAIDGHPFEGRIADMADEFKESTDIASIDTLVSLINTIGPSAISLGFTRFSVDVSKESIAFKIISADPAPVLHNLADGGLDKAQPPTLSLGRTQVKPGATGVTVVGGNFPAQSMNQLSVWWINTATPSVRTGIITYHPAGASAAPQHPASIASSGVFEYKATGLQPNTDYVFKACCNGPLASSAFSEPLTLRTASTAAATLHLNPASEPTLTGQTLGSTSLPAAAGTWTPPPVAIPANMAPGDYLIVAMLEGAVLASAPIKVLPAGATATPVLEVVDAGSTPPSVIPAPANTIGGRGFTLQGKNFQPGAVTVKISGQAQGTVVDADAEGGFLLNLAAPGDQTSKGLVTITATGLNGAASTTILELGIFTV
jgi:hypothetical protein